MYEITSCNSFPQGTCVFQWASEASNRQAFETFEAVVASALQTCLPKGTSNVRSFQTERVDLWRAYHSVRTSEAFITLWRELIGKVTSEPAEPLRCMLTADVSDTDATVVLEMLVKLWIVIRGFSFTSAWLELYKQRKKKSLQRSKALRKDIH